MRKRKWFCRVLCILVSGLLLVNPGIYALSLNTLDSSFGFLGIEARKTGVLFVWKKESTVPTYIKGLVGSSFFVGLMVPKKEWWVNLDLFISPEDSLGKGLQFTPAGRVLMEADVKLKRYAMRLLSESMEGGLLGDSMRDVSLRFWIEPHDVSVFVDKDSLRFNSMRLQVKAEVIGNRKVEHFINAEIVPQLTRLVNESSDFEELRLVCKALIASWWYKKHCRNGIYKDLINKPSSKLIDNRFWTRRDYISDYMATFISSKIKGLGFISISSGGVKIEPERTQEKEKRDIEITDKEKTSKVDLKPEVPVFGGKVNLNGVEVRGKVAIVSMCEEEVELYDLLGEDKKIEEEIIFIHPDGRIERIRRSEEGERGVFIAKDKAIVITPEGEIVERDFSGNPDLISFGTSGWRFKVPVNLQGEEKEKEEEKLLKKMVSALHGFADYYWDHINLLPKDRRGVVVFRDSRYMGDKFVELAVQVLASRGIPVYFPEEGLESTICPTPLVAFAIHELNAAFGINFTASHNPVEDNGFKVTPYDGGAAPPEVTDEIGMRINERVFRLRPVEKTPYQEESINLFSMEKLIESYASYVKEELKNTLGEKVYEEALKNIGSGKDITKIVTSALHGSAGKVLERLAKAIFPGVEFEINQEEPKSDFGGLVSPDPSREMLGEKKETKEGRVVGVGVIKKIKSLQGKGVGFGPDGDADRVAIVDSKGEYISPAHFMGLIVEFLNKYGKRKGGVVKTVATSDFPLAVALKWGQQREEMKVGFKWARPFWNDERFVVIGEESAHEGLSGTKTWDDGLLMGILAILMESYYRKYEHKSLSDVISELEKRDVGYYKYERINVRLTPDLKNNLKNLFDTLYSQKGSETVEGGAVKELSGLNWVAIENAYGERIKKVVLLDGVKIVFEDNGWFAVRLSGTEPVARLYVEGVDRKKENAETKKERLKDVGTRFLNGEFNAEGPDNNGSLSGRSDSGESFTDTEISNYIENMKEYNLKEWKGLINLLRKKGYGMPAFILAIDCFMEGLIDAVPDMGKETLKPPSEKDVKVMKYVYDCIKESIVKKDLPEFITQRSLLSKFEAIRVVELNEVEPIEGGEGFVWKNKADSKIRLGVIYGGDKVLLVGDPLSEEKLQEVLNIIDGDLKSVLGEEPIYSFLRGVGLNLEMPVVAQRKDLYLLYVGKGLRILNTKIPIVDDLAFLAAMRSPQLTSTASKLLQQVKDSKGSKQPVPQKAGGILLYEVSVF